jgi:hypothetical protein
MSQPPPPSRTPPPAPRRPPPLTPLEHAIAESEGSEEEVSLGTLFARNLTRALMVGLIPAMMVLGTGATAWVLSVVPPIRAAASATYTAVNDYHAALKQSHGLMTELAELGTPVAPLEAAWFEFAEAPEEARAETADHLMTVLVDQVQQVRGSRGEEVSHLVVLLSDATRARRRASDAWHEWTDKTSTLRGRAAVVFGIARSPPPDLSRYDQPLPGGRDLPPE